jgi:hypothetical protein
MQLLGLVVNILRYRTLYVAGVIMLKNRLADYLCGRAFD